MTLVHSDDWLTIHQGDCREVMAGMEAESVNCVVTSPPYWGLRDYGTATWAGGDPEHDHSFKPDAGATTIRKTQTYQQGHPHRDCKCGAIRQDRQLGLEPTPEEYVANMVDVFREVRRVLRADGTLWLNLGDSYASGDGGRHGDNAGVYRAKGASAQGRGPRPLGLKPKDLVGIPWRVAFALQSDGWYVRSDIIWSKPNPMPESVTDRPTKAHEYVFLLSKSARYWYDADAVREHGTSGPSDLAKMADPQARIGGKHKDLADPLSKANAASRIGQMRAVGSPERNLRSVWTVATQPYPGAHFATFPEKLIEPPIKAGCPEGGTVMDPFGGSGTVARVANRLSRRAVLIDLNGDYIRQQFDRNRELPLGLVGGDAA